MAQSGPTNDNGWRPGDPEPGLFSTRKRAIESMFAGLFLIVGMGFAWWDMDSSHRGTALWLLGISVAGMIVAALYRLIRHGRA